MPHAPRFFALLFALTLSAVPPVAARADFITVEGEVSNNVFFTTLEAPLGVSFPSRQLFVSAYALPPEVVADILADPLFPPAYTSLLFAVPTQSIPEIITFEGLLSPDTETDLLAGVASYIDELETATGLTFSFDFESLVLGDVISFLSETRVEGPDTVLYNGTVSTSLLEGRVVIQQLSAVPEPSSMALFGLGVTGLLGFASRRQRRVTKLPRASS